MTQSRSAIMNSFAELCKENLSSNYRCEAKTRLNLSRVRFSPFQYVFAGKREIVIKSFFVIVTRMNINLDSYKSKTFILFKKKEKIPALFIYEQLCVFHTTIGMKGKYDYHFVCGFSGWYLLVISSCLLFNFHQSLR